MPKLTEMKKEMLDKAIRQKVFDEACPMLKKEGLGGFTMDKLAAAVGVSKGTLYNYFRDKLDVVTFINGQLFRESAAEIERSLEAEGDPGEVLGNCLRCGRGKMDKFRFLQVAMLEMLMETPSDKRRELLRKDPENMATGAFIKFFQRGIDNGTFRKVKPELLELVLGAVMDGLSVRAELNGGSDVSDPELLDSVLDILLNGMRVRDGEGK